MNDKDKAAERIDKASADIVAETMKEICDELNAAEEEKEAKEKEAKEEIKEEADKEEREELDEDSKEEGKEELSDASDEGDEEESEDGEPVEEDERIKKHRRKKKALLIGGSSLGVLAAVYLGAAAFFVRHFYINTKINGNTFSAKTVAQVESYMEKQVKDYQLKFLEEGGASEIIRGTDIDIEYVREKKLETLLKEQKPLLWISALFKPPSIEASVGVKYDEEKLNKAVENLRCMKPEAQAAPVSASPVFQETKFVIKPETEGTQIDKEKFGEAVKEAIEGFKGSLDLKKAKVYVPPKFTAESPEVIKARDAMNSYLDASITYDFSPASEVVNAPVIAGWLSVDADMNVVFSQEAVRGFIQGLSDKYDTFGRTRTITTASGNTAQVEGGNYGWLINQEAEYERLTGNIKNAETVTREPEYSQRAVSREGNDFGNTYVEIDLTKQHMWFVQDGSVALESDIVTGNPNKGNATPQGVYSMAYKSKNQVLRGKKLPNGSYEYESPVAFWMPFNGGIGLHDANWQSAFGGARYQTYGSHGCVNLPPGIAGQLYGYVDAGTPVVCHF